MSFVNVIILVLNNLYCLFTLNTSIHILLSVCHQHCVRREMERREEEEEERRNTADSEEEEEGAAAGEGDDGDDDEEQTDKDGGDEDEYDDDKDVAEMKKKSKGEEGTSCSDRKCVPGIIYLGHIPPRLRPKHLRNLLSVYGEIGRVFLQPEGNVGPHGAGPRSADRSHYDLCGFQFVVRLEQI